MSGTDGVELRERDRRPLAARFRWPVGLLLVALLPVVRVCAIHQGFGIRAAAMTAIAVGAVAALDVLHRLGRLRRGELAAAAGAAGALAVAAGGVRLGPWVAASVWFAAWIGWDAPLPVRWGRAFDARLLPVVLVLTLAAARYLRHPSGFRDGAVLAVASGIAAIALVPLAAVVGRAMRMLVGGVRAVLGTVLPVLLLAPLWVLLALVPWILDRLVRFDPLRSESARTSWVARSDRPDDPRRPWFADPRRDRLPWRWRAHAKAPVVAGSVIAMAALLAVVVSPDLLGRPDPPRSEAEQLLRESADYEELDREHVRVIEQMTFSQFVGAELREHTSRLVNVRDGRRATTRPSACRPRRVVVWMFGGSSLYGLLQRDDETIPSALVRAAEQRGIPLHVENFGVPGDVTWQQGRRLERALALGPPPDLVVFYGGWNDLSKVSDMELSDGFDDDDVIGPMDNIEMRALTRAGGLGRGDLRVWFRAPQPDRSQSVEWSVTTTARQLRMADATARLLTGAADVPLVSFHQPTVHDRPDGLGDYPQGGDTGRAVAELRRRLPDDVVDLGDVLDDVDLPLFWDEVHTRAEANPHVAAAMLDEITPVVAPLAAERRAAPCR